MMFGCHMAFALAILALVAAGAFLGYASKLDSCCKSLLKAVGYVALVAAALNLLSLGYMSVKSCGDGGCSLKRGGGHNRMMGPNGQMPGGMMPPNMQQPVQNPSGSGQ